jgi:hypothetical protein
MFQELLSRLARALDGAGISYMVIGGQAVLLHGEPRLTRDIDVTLGVASSELTRVRHVVEQQSLRPSIPDVEAFVRKTNVLPLTDETTAIRVDLIFSFTPYESEAIRRTVAVQFGTTTVRFAAAEDLIIHKLIAGRPRDLDDVAGVLARRPTLDEKYLLKWLTSFRDVVHRDLAGEYRRLRNPLDADAGRAHAEP